MRQVSSVHHQCIGPNASVPHTSGCIRERIRHRFHGEALARIEHNAFLDTDYMVLGGRVRRARRWQSVYHDRELSGLSETLRNDVFRNMDETVGNFLDRASNLFRGAFDVHVAHAGGAMV